MPPVVVVIAMGEMGSGVASRLRERGAEVRTSLNGRSAASQARAGKAGAIVAEDDVVLMTGADVILSIVPPGEAVALAERLAPALRAQRAKPLYVDCNAVSPATVKRVAGTVADAGASFVDAGIIGPPPRESTPGPKFYASGPDALRLLALRDHGLDIRLIEGGIGAASALKMAYGSLTKGLTALGAVMMLGAESAGIADPLRRELADSQPALWAWLQRQVPSMYPKAYRWVAEMEEIAAYLADQPAGQKIYAGAAELYERLARAAAEKGAEIEALSRFVKS
jgi:3-hydroxyisobutyrate dehydrogenase-like beta-hydroxyacid dehydrogenase